MAELKEIVGSVLAEKRREAGLTQEKLAFACGVHPTFISQIERGVKNPTLKTLFTVCKALGIRPTDVVAQVEKLVE